MTVTDDTEKPRPFETWERDGRIYYALGLVTLWQRGWAPAGESWSDPPRLSDDLLAWMREHEVVLNDDYCFGPPHLVFPSREVAEKFQREWHEPGEVCRLDFYDRVRRDDKAMPQFHRV